MLPSVQGKATLSTLASNELDPGMGMGGTFLHALWRGRVPGGLRRMGAEFSVSLLAQPLLI